MARPGETVGGGFFVMRRAANGRLRTGIHCHPYEHATLEGAAAEAKRLAAKEGKCFAVLQQVSEFRSNPAPENKGATHGHQQTRQEGGEEASREESAEERAQEGGVTARAAGHTPRPAAAS